MIYVFNKNKGGDIMDIFDTTRETETITPEDVGEIETETELFHTENEIASSGSQKSGPNGITKEIHEKAIKLAESPKGLDIAAFQKKHNISVMNVDELLKG
jgi:hypothetical protein